MEARPGGTERSRVSPSPASSNLFDSDEEDMPTVTEMKMAPTRVTKPVEKLEVHWRTLEALTTSRITDPSLISDLHRKMLDIADIVIEEEIKLAPANGQITPCLEYLLNIDAFQSLVECTQRQQEYGMGLRDAVMKFIMQLLSSSKQPLLMHSQLLRPLLRLLDSSRTSESKENSTTVVSLVFQIWCCIERDTSLVALFEDGGGSGQPRPSSGFPLVDLLMDHIHLDGDVGEWTRGAFLAILRVCSLPAGKGVEAYLEKSVFCQMTASGLGARYASLPTEKECFDDGGWWHLLREGELLGVVPELKGMLQLLEFCDSVVKVASVSTNKILLECVRVVFLHQVLGPALLQERPEAMLLSTLYLTSFLRHVTSLPLMRELLAFVLKGHYDGRAVLEQLVVNISSSNTAHTVKRLQLTFVHPWSWASVSCRRFKKLLSSVTMHLMLTLVDLNCEDVILQLVLQHLVHGQHLSEALWPRIGDTDVYNEAAVRFLSLIPRVCQEGERKYYRSSLEKMEDADASKVDQASPVDPHTLQVSPATLNGAIAAPQGRSSPRLGRSKKLTTPTLTPKSKATPSATPTSQLMPLTPDNDPTLNGPLSEEAAYFHYLSLAHEEVEACASACRCWSSAYSSVVRDDRHQRADIQPQEGRQRRQTADVGLFLQAVLEKLGSLLSLPHQQAVLLCGLLSRLAQFPQPLLRSFLLRHRLVLKEGVPDLHEVLEGLKKEVEGLSAVDPDMDLNLARARKTLAIRAYLALQDPPNPDNSAISTPHSFEILEPVSSVTPKKHTLKAPSPRRPSRFATSPFKKKKISSNTYFCVVIFHDFLKELAALSQQHSILDPDIYTPQSAV